MTRAGLSIADSNPRYWAVDEEPVLLLGGSSEDNLFQVADVASELEELASVGGNYVRCTMSAREEFAVYPFEETEDGYDLDSWNEEYWTRFETFLSACADHDVVAQIEVWATFDYYMENWRENPFNPACNVTYTAEESGLEPDVGDSAPHYEGHNDFFYSVPAELDLGLLRTYQERFVEKLLDVALEYDNVLYCIDNETDVSPAWPDYWARFIDERAAERDTTALLTEMWLETDITHGDHDAVVEQPDLYDYVEVSQNNQSDGRDHYDRVRRMHERLDPPRPLNNVKIYGADAVGWTGGDREGVERFWRNLFAGAASVRFHRPPAGQGLNQRAKRAIRAARDVFGAFEFTTCRPTTDVLANTEGAAYALAGDGTVVIYFPSGTSATVEPTALGATPEVRWYDVDSCSWTAIESVTGDAPRLDPADDGRWIALVQSG